MASPDNFVSVACPHCSKSMKAKPELVGRIVRCPSCSKQFMAESLTVETLIEPEQTESSASDQKIFDIQPKQNEKIITPSQQSIIVKSNDHMGFKMLITFMLFPICCYSWMMLFKAVLDTAVALHLMRNPTN